MLLLRLLRHLVRDSGWHLVAEGDIIFWYSPGSTRIVLEGAGADRLTVVGCEILAGRRGLVGEVDHLVGVELLLNPAESPRPWLLATRA